MITPESITALSEEHGFRQDTMEQFLMDYLVHRRVAGGIECVTKGGMCMPFYQPGGTLPRLSVDIDLATRLPASDAESAARLAADLPNVTGVERYVPSRRAVLKNNLATYDVRYMSCFGPERRVKVDFLHGLDLGYGTRTVPAGTMIIGFEIPHQMKILTRSALLADKFGTLAAGTIGLDASRAGEIAKQVFDIGVLLGGAAAGEIAGFFAEFHNMLDAERVINDKPDLAARTVVDGIEAALARMQTVDGDVRFGGLARKGYEDFASAYISSGVPYQRNDHHANILAAKVLNRLMGRALDGEDGGGAAARMRGILADAGGVRDYRDVRELYGPAVRGATGIPERHLARMDARLSCLLCAHAALAPD